MVTHTWHPQRQNMDSAPSMKRPLTSDLVAHEEISPDAMGSPTKMPRHAKVPDTVVAITKLPLDAFGLMINTPDRLADMAAVCREIRNWIQPTITELEPKMSGNCKGCWRRKDNLLRYYCTACVSRRGLLLPMQLVCPNLFSTGFTGPEGATPDDTIQSVDLGMHHPYDETSVTTVLVVANHRALLLRLKANKGTNDFMETEAGKRMQAELEMTEVALKRLGFESESRGRSDRAHRAQLLNEISGRPWNSKELIDLDLPLTGAGN
jgi:hypothetical protein